MTFDPKRQVYTLSTDRTFYAHRGIIGLDQDAGAAGLFSTGYDGDVSFDGRDADIADTDEERRVASAWTFEERKELAGEMIRRWLTFAGVTNLDEPVTG